MIQAEREHNKPCTTKSYVVWKLSPHTPVVWVCRLACHQIYPSLPEHCNEFTPLVFACFSNVYDLCLCPCLSQHVYVDQKCEISPFWVWDFSSNKVRQCLCFTVTKYFSQGYSTILSYHMNDGSISRKKLCKLTSLSISAPMHCKYYNSLTYTLFALPSYGKMQ